MMQAAMQSWIVVCKPLDVILAREQANVVLVVHWLPKSSIVAVLTAQPQFE